ncbi:unnamed protein product [Lepidochelys olivacea]
MRAWKGQLERKRGQERAEDRKRHWRIGESRTVAKNRRAPARKLASAHKEIAQRLQCVRQKGAAGERESCGELTQPKGTTRNHENQRKTDNRRQRRAERKAEE